jgi:hypothetical protein
MVDITLSVMEAVMVVNWARRDASVVSAPYLPLGPPSMIIEGQAILSAASRGETGVMGGRCFVR